MTIMLGFSDGDAIPFESRFNDIEKAYGEAIVRRVIHYEGKIYITAAIVKVGIV